MDTLDILGMKNIKYDNYSLSFDGLSEGNATLFGFKYVDPVKLEEQVFNVTATSDEWLEGIPVPATVNYSIEGFNGTYDLKDKMSNFQYTIDGKNWVKFNILEDLKPIEEVDPSDNDGGFDITTDPSGNLVISIDKDHKITIDESGNITSTKPDDKLPGNLSDLGDITITNPNVSAGELSLTNVSEATIANDSISFTADVTGDSSYLKVKYGDESTGEDLIVDSVLSTRANAGINLTGQNVTYSIKLDYGSYNSNNFMYSIDNGVTYSAIDSSVISNWVPDLEFNVNPKSEPGHNLNWLWILLLIILILSIIGIAVFLVYWLVFRNKEEKESK